MWYVGLACFMTYPVVIRKILLEEGTEALHNWFKQHVPNTLYKDFFS